MKSHLLTIVQDIITSVETKDFRLAYQTNLALLEVQPYERYLVIKGFKLANFDNFFRWAHLLTVCGHEDAKDCMILLLEGIYLINESDEISRQFNDVAYSGNNLEFFTDELKSLGV